MEQPSENQPPESGSARLRVLEMIDKGVISAEEGMRLLQAFSAEDAAAETGASADARPVPIETESLANAAVLSLEDGELPLPGGVSAPAAPAASASPAALPADARKWQRWWMVPVWAGVAITVFGGVFMYLALRGSGTGFWFVCASLPFILGIVVIVLAWGSRNAPWLHLRVRQAPGERPERIAFSMPLPLRPAAWFLKTFGRWIPNLKEQAWDEVIMAVGDTTGPENPLYIVVDEEETGEKVEIYMG